MIPPPKREGEQRVGIIDKNFIGEKDANQRRPSSHGTEQDGQSILARFPIEQSFIWGQYINIFLIALCEGTSKILSLPNNDSALSQPPSIMQSQMSLIPNTGKLKEFASLFWPFAAKKYPPN